MAALLSISQRLYGASVAMAGTVILSELSAFTGWASLSLNIISWAKYNKLARRIKNFVMIFIDDQKPVHRAPFWNLPDAACV